MLLAYVLSPTADQSLVIATFFRRYHSAKIIGVCLDGEYVPQHIKEFSQIISISQLDLNNNIIIPTGAKGTKSLLEKGDIMLGSVTLSQSALRVFDKAWMVAHALNIGLPAPRTWKSLEETLSYPIFYKQSFEKGGGARGIAQNRRDIPVSEVNKLLFQEWIKSQGTYGVSFLAEQGQILASHTHFERESLPKEGGAAVIIERFNDNRLLEYTERLIQSLRYSGWGLAEFKYCPKRDDYVFMEINAKFWASCEFAFINEPLFLKLLFNIDSREKPVQQMFFVDRAFGRGVRFVLQNLNMFVNGSSCRLYSTPFIQALAKITPSYARKFFKLLLRRSANA